MIVAHQNSISKRLIHFLYKFVAGLVMFIQNFVIKWIYKPLRNWWNPSPYSVPVTPAEFYALLEANDIEQVKRALGAGRNPNALVPDPRHPKGRTTERKLPLSVAVTQGKKDMTEVLVRHGANPFKSVYNQKSPIELAVDLDRATLVEAMLRLCIGMKPPNAVLRKKVKIILANILYQTVKKNNGSLCRLLLQYGADAFSNRFLSYWQVCKNKFQILVFYSIEFVIDDYQR